MITKYQIIKIGSENPFYKDVLDTFYHHIEELGLAKESIIEINENTAISTHYAISKILHTH